MEQNRVKHTFIIVNITPSAENRSDYNRQRRKSSHIWEFFVWKIRLVIKTFARKREEAKPSIRIMFVPFVMLVKGSAEPIPLIIVTLSMDLSVSLNNRKYYFTSITRLRAGLHRINLLISSTLLKKTVARRPNSSFTLFVIDQWNK